MKHQTRIFVFLTAVLAAVSCARISPMEDTDMPISFGSYQYRATKADVSGFADGTVLPDGSSFGVFAFFHEGTTGNPGSWATAAADPNDALTNHPNFMLNQKVDVSVDASSNYTYSYTPVRFWPAAGSRITFYAYYPYVANGYYMGSSPMGGAAAQFQLVTYMTKDTDGQGSFGFDVAYEAKDQIDFMVSDLCADQNKKENILTGTASSTETVQFDFHHVLSQVRIATLNVVNDNPYVSITPKEIRFDKIAVHGELTVAEDWSTLDANGKVNNTFTWSNLLTDRVGNTIEGVHVEYTGAKKPGETDEAYAIRTKQNYLMMIPQPFSDDATITIIYDVVRTDDGTGEHYSYTDNEVSAPLKSAKVGGQPLLGWEQNKIYTYTASVSLTGIELTASYVDWTEGSYDLDLTAATP